MSEFNQDWKCCALGIVAVVGLVILLSVSCSVESDRSEVPATESTPNTQRLVGHWVRPDGGYVLEIRRVRSGGRVEASYYNPRPINVETAELRQVGNEIGVFIELRDRGYPGSYYELRYNEEADVLVGDYFQATQQLVYEVEFVRRPTP